MAVGVEAQVFRLRWPHVACDRNTHTCGNSWCGASFSATFAKRPHVMRYSPI